MKCTPSPAPAPTNAPYVYYGTQFLGTDDISSLIPGGSIGDTLDMAATEFNIPYGGSAMGATENQKEEVIPLDGTIKNLYVWLDIKAGNFDLAAYRFTLRKAGVGDTALTCTVQSPATTGNDLVNSVAVVAGDRISLKVEPLVNPSNAPIAKWGFCFEASVNNCSIGLTGGWTAAQLPALNSYCSLYSVQTVDLLDPKMAHACTIRRLFVHLVTAPGAGKTHTFRVYKTPATATALQVTIADANTDNSDLVNAPVLNDDDVLYLYHTVAGGPATSYVNWGFVTESSGGGGGGVVTPKAGMANKLVGEVII